MKNVLVLGGGGFIGRNIVEHLVNRGDCNVTAADIKEGSNWSKILNNDSKSDRFKTVLADFTDINAFDNLNQNFDEVYMLAAVVGVNRTLKFPQDVIRTNTLLTMNTLDWISRNPIKRLLFSSSSENYSGTSDLFNVEIPTAEDVPLCIGDVKHPRWTYAMTKMHGESAFLLSAESYNFECTVVRYQNIIGPEMGFGHAIPHIVERFVKGEKSPFKIYGHDQTRAFCYIDDAVMGTVGAMESKNAIGEIYHIGMQDEINMNTLTTYIGDLMQYKGDYEEAMTYPGSVARRCPNINKAKADFGYSPSTDWKKAVSLTADWYYEFFTSGKSPKSGGFETPEAILKKLRK
ncbi:NAD(P)-dependent oxidoreductase [Gammaproteobacteria bacterium]|nr:NAD(P)-dependent oxidoreductase [Gammaproteobacteria bacterium]